MQFEELLSKKVFFSFSYFQLKWNGSLLAQLYTLLFFFFDSKKKLCALYGKWTECLYSVDPATFEAYKKNDKKNAEEKKSSKQVLVLEGAGASLKAL